MTSSAPLCVSCLTICMLEMPHVMARCVIGTIFSFFVGPRRECLIFITILHPNCYRQDNCDREGLQAEKAGKIQENNCTTKNYANRRITECLIEYTLILTAIVLSLEHYDLLNNPLLV